MIRVELQGGLGNQLFIWAMAHRLMKEYNVHVRIVIPIDKHNRADRPCELFGLVDLCEHNISVKESRLFSALTKVIDKISNYKAIRSLDLIQKLRIINHKFADEYLIDSTQPPRILRGYFQSKEVPDSTKKEIHSEIMDYLKKLNFPNSVLTRTIGSVAHIRRGDTREIANEWGIISLDYYDQLINPLDDPIICTDDINFSAQISDRFPKSLVISSSESSAWQVLKIISNSKEFIMANSTLSWWGAWVAINHSSSIIYFPDPWRPANARLGESLKFPSAILAPSIFELD